MTGAVIDLSSAISRVWFFVGLGLILGGVFIAWGTAGLEKHASERMEQRKLLKLIFLISIMIFIIKH